MFARFRPAVIFAAFVLMMTGSAHPQSPRRDAFGDPLPKGVLFRLGTVRLRHDDLVTALSWSPDGHTLASAGWDSEVRLWQIPGGKQLAKWDHIEENIVFSPDGKILAAATEAGVSDPTVHVWSWPTGKELYQRSRDEVEFEMVAFSPDGKYLALAGDRNIRLLNPATGEVLFRFQGPGTQVMALAFSPDGSLLALAGMNGLVSLWDVPAKKVARRLSRVGERISAFAVAADERTLLTHTRDGTLTLWDSRDGHRLRSLDPGPWIIGNLLVAPDGSRALTLPRTEEMWFPMFQPEHIPALWDLRACRRLPALSKRNERIGAAAFSPDSKTVALGCFNDDIHLRNLATGKEIRQFVRQQRCPTFVSGLAWSPDGRWLVANYDDGALKLWDLQQRRPRPRRLCGGDAAMALAFSADSRLLAATGDGKLNISIFEVISGAEIRQLSGHGPLAFAADNRTLAAGDSTSAAIHLWDVPSGKRIHALKGHAEPVHTLVFASGGNTLFSGGCDDTVLCWDIARVLHRPFPQKELSAARLPQLWTYLAGNDAARAQRAVAELIQAPDAALPLLEKSLPPVPPVKRTRLTALIADLDHEEFIRRDNASTELAKIGEPAAPALRAVLKENPSLEMRRRIEALLEPIESRPLSPDGLRAIRALQVLETISTPEARRLLERLAGGADGAMLTQQAKASLQRLERRRAIP